MSTPRAAWSAPPAVEPDPAAAALFREGRKLVEAGDWQRGCAKFEASIKRYPSASTALNLARCREHDGKLASAWALYKRSLVLNRETPGAKRRAALERIAQEGIAKLEPRLPRLRVVADDQPDGFVVTQDGLELPAGSSLPLDPGKHELVASAPGHESERRVVELVEGETTTVEFALKPSVQEPDPRPAPQAAEPVAPPAPAEPAEPSEPEGTPAWVWVVGGAGVVLAGVGVAFALDAQAAADTLETKCGADLVCDEDPSFDPAPLNARKNRGVGLAIGLGSAGAVAIGVAIVGLTASSGKSARVHVTPWASSEAAGVGMLGRF